MHVIAVANQKGGVGKTTTSVSLAACLARLNKRVLLLDLDQQVNATAHVNVTQPQNETESVYVLLADKTPDVRRLIVPAGPNLALIPGHIAMAEIDIKLSNVLNREGRLARALAQVQGDYDFVIMDCPPSLGIATINALVAATHLIITVETAWFSYDAVTRLMAIVSEVVEQSNPNLKVYALATLHRGNVNVHRDVLDKLREVFGNYAFKSVIRHTATFVEASAAHQSIVDYAHGSRGHQDYQALTEEMLQRVQEAQVRDSVAEVG